MEAYSENFSEMIQNLLSSLVKTKVPSKLLSSEMTALLEHVKRHTRSIEIKYQSEEDAPEILTRVYFEFNPAVSVAIYYSMTICILERIK